MMNRRVQRDIWQGLYDFYLIETPRAVKTDRLLSEDALLKKLSKAHSDKVVSRRYRHILTHQVIISTFTVLEHRQDVKADQNDLKFFSARKIGDLPKPVLISRFLEDYRLL